MDDATLKNLQVAYNAAPSPELALVIVNALVERQQWQAITVYFPIIAKGLAYEHYKAIVVGLLQSENEATLAEFLKHGELDHAEALIRHFSTDGKKMQAQKLYEAAVAVDQDFAKRNIEDFFGDKKKREEKVKLRVVEKVDFGEITDLSRYQQKTTDFSDVVGLEAIKKQIHKKIILPFQKPSLFQRFKKKVGGGVLLYGPPGCGKTLLARATAGECRAAFFNVDISDVLDMYIGESEQKLHAIFEKARASTPSVLFFDELEALAGKREHSRNRSTSNIVSQFLTELDGFSQNNAGVLVLASTNVPWSIDPAFLRPGRFDRMFFVPPPDRLARDSILRHHMKERPCEGDIEYAAIAAKTGGYSGADLANLVEMAADEAIDASIEQEKEVGIELAHFMTALRESRSTTTEWLTTARNYARYANDGGRYDDVLDFLKQHGRS